jgi:hypothetical protein
MNNFVVACALLLVLLSSPAYGVWFLWSLLAFIGERIRSDMTWTR